MRLIIDRKEVKISPDSTRVIAKFFFNGEERAVQLIKQVLELSKEEIFKLISPILQDFSKRHRNITQKLEKHCQKVEHQIKLAGVDPEKLDEYTRLLIGSYFTHEYSIESAAFFNPSIIEDIDQSNLEKGQLRVISSFRVDGEGRV